MTGRLRLILTLHNHQPVGNFDGVCEAAYQDSYVRFLNVADEFPELRFVLHNSGSLLEWIERAHPEYIARVRSLVESGRIELLGGPYYEPILAAIPRRDRLGQISLYREKIRKLFGVDFRGAWMPERVWEPSFAGDLADAHVDYTLLDDAHFRLAGVSTDRLAQYYLAEDGGRMTRVFAGSERLRYLIPYADPYEVIGHLKSLCDAAEQPVVVFGDDGEKFGVWPGSQQHVYGSGWLRRFFQALRESQEWLQTTTFAETVAHVAPAGRVYLPESSYREMTEWALTTERQHELREFGQRCERDPEWRRFQPFVRAGFWRNFLAKYPEANEMYCRMLQVSGRIDRFARQADAATSPRLAHARRDLYRAQCNCPYWHGAFGGLYLPHLRNAVYSHLIAADAELESLAGSKGRWVRLEADDFNLDGRKEARIATDRFVALLAPATGGHLYEFDVRAIRHNLLATLNRRPEPYHERIRQAHGTPVTQGEGGGVDPNGGVRFKQPDLDQKLVYDRWPRKSLVDHFLQPKLTLAQFAAGQGEMGDFANGAYRALLRKRGQRAEVRMTRTGRVGPFEPTVSKTVSIDAAFGGAIEVEYVLEALPPGMPIHFAVEWNFAGLPAGAHDRYYYDETGRQLGQLETQHELKQATRVGMVDEWLGVDVSLESSRPGLFWMLPVQTVSQSESGFELVHQSCAVAPNWEFVAPADGRWSVTLTMTVDTSAAQARQLASAAPAGSRSLVGA